MAGFGDHQTVGGVVLCAVVPFPAAVAGSQCVDVGLRVAGEGECATVNAVPGWVALRSARIRRLISARVICCIVSAMVLPLSLLTELLVVHCVEGGDQLDNLVGSKS